MYCLDLARQRALCAVTPEANPLFAAPFLYQAQRELARYCLSVPFEAVAQMSWGQGPVCAALVFSPGRTGSTLLSQLLNAAGIPSISEPDFLTQLTDCKRQGKDLGAASVLMAVSRAGLGSLTAHCRALPVVKLRAECNPVATELALGVPEARCYFIFRELRAWARSRHRAFGRSPEHLARTLLQAVRAYVTLKRKRPQTALIWYEDLIHQPADVLGRHFLGGHSLNEAQRHALAKAMEQDAQEGTSLSQEQLAQRRFDAETESAFLEAWRAIRPAALLRGELAPLAI